MWDKRGVFPENLGKMNKKGHVLGTSAVSSDSQDD